MTIWTAPKFSPRQHTVVARRMDVGKPSRQLQPPRYLKSQDLAEMRSIPTSTKPISALQVGPASLHRATCDFHGKVVEIPRPHQRQNVITYDAA
jgi:hypothetical protein